MSKLLKLKEWLTITDAARHLSIMFEEEVSEADVLQLATEGHLRLSVNFVNHADGKRANIVPIESAMFYVFHQDKSEIPNLKAKNIRLSEIEHLPDDIKNGLQDGSMVLTPMGDAINEKQIVEYEKNVVSLTGIFDLPMVAAERLDVEYALQQRAGGPEVTLVCIDGALVESSSGQLFQLQERFDDNEYCSGSLAQLERLKRHIVENEIGQQEAEKILNTHKENRRKFLEEQASKPWSERFYPAGGLPEDGVLVVRPAALQELQAGLAGPPTEPKPLTTKERRTLLTIIAALAKEARVDISKPSKAGGMIENMTERMGARVSARTVEGHLKQISDALESRASHTS